MFGPSRLGFRAEALGRQRCEWFAPEVPVLVHVKWTISMVVL